LIQTIAYLPQNPNDLLFAETVLEELKTTLSNHDLKRSEEELLDFLGFFGLEPMKNRFPRDLSVGERQRTALAAITVHDPRVILLDEPTRGMDYDAKDRLISLTKTWRSAGKAILLVTHDVELAAMLSDRTIILEAGRIQFNGSPKIAFTQFPNFQTQTAKMFPGTGWITPADVVVP
jgi:energy-coupling factor transport system ATP-binding protein